MSAPGHKLAGLPLVTGGSCGRPTGVLLCVSSHASLLLGSCSWQCRCSGVRLSMGDVSAFFRFVKKLVQLESLLPYWGGPGGLPGELRSCPVLTACLGLPL